MPDDPTAIEDEKPPVEPQKEEPKVSEPKGLTMEDLEKHKREILDEIQALHGADKAEREELKAELAKANEYIEEQKKAEAKRDEIKDSKSTIVIPPNDIPPQQPNIGTTPPSGANGGDVKKVPFWKRAW